MTQLRSYTTIEQSKMLMEIGIPNETADMYFIFDIVDGYYHNVPTFWNESAMDTPCWSLAALLEIIPDKISINNESYYLSFDKKGDKKGIAFRGPITWDGQKSKSFDTDNIIDAVFEMVVWLKENNLI